MSNELAVFDELLTSGEGNYHDFLSVPACDDDPVEWAGFVQSEWENELDRQLAEELRQTRKTRRK
jgi:hypothetical protein